MTKINASKEGLTIIEEKREEKKWNKSDNSKALPEISKCQFLQTIDSRFRLSDGKTLTLEQLEDLIESETFSRNSNEIIRQYIRKTRQRGCQTITNDEIDRLIEYDGVHTKGITSINWRNFLAGKAIDKEAFIAFCENLGIEDWRKVANLPPIYQKDRTKHLRLVEALSLFNHREQIDILMDSLSRKKRVFLVNNSCHYSRTWMLRRLDDEIRAFFKLPNRTILLSGTRYEASGMANLKKKFTEGLLLPSTINKNLKRENLILVLDIDNYDQFALEKMILEIWEPLLNQISPHLLGEGSIILFLLASQQGNDWQMEWQANPNLLNKITLLPQANLFDLDSLRDLGRTFTQIAIKLGKSLCDCSRSCNCSLELATNICQKSKNNSEILLKEIYRYFNCQTTEFSIWQRYPHP